MPYRKKKRVTCLTTSSRVVKLQPPRTRVAEDTKFATQEIKVFRQKNRYKHISRKLKLAKGLIEPAHRAKPSFTWPRFGAFLNGLKKPRNLAVVLIVAGLAGTAAYVNLAQAGYDTVTDNTSPVFSYFDYKAEEEELVTVKASDPQKLVSDTNADLTSVSVAASENLRINAEEAALTQLIQPNELTESAYSSNPEVTATAFQNNNVENLFYEYVVQPGDTLSSIARASGIREDALAMERGWDDLVKPGDILKIPTTNDPFHRVEEGHTIDEIAQRYAVASKDIIDANDLSADGTVTPGEFLTIPGGLIEDRPAPPPPVQVTPSRTRRVATASRNTASSSTSRRSTSSSSASTSTGQSYAGGTGWCVGYARTRRPDIAVRGNAGTWLGSASAQGYSTGGAPQAGAVEVSNKSAWGHVAVVDEVYADGSYKVTEQNYKGYGIVSSRVVPAGDGTVQGFIY